MLIVALMATITRVAHGEITVERIREFVCDTSAIGNQQDIAFVENGDMGETIFIRPADQECHFYLFHRGASGDETQLSGDLAFIFESPSRAYSAGCLQTGEWYSSRLGRSPNWIDFG